MARFSLDGGTDYQNPGGDGGYTPPDPPPTFPPPTGGGYTPPNYTPPTFPTDPGTGLPRVTNPTPIDGGMESQPRITTQPLPRATYSPAPMAAPLAPGQESDPRYASAYAALQGLPQINAFNPTTGVQAVSNPYYQAPAATTNTAFDPASWVKQQLGAAQSTDDPNYWIGKISGDTNVTNPGTRDSALSYWADRIMRGDGALGVRNGTVSKYNEGAAPAPAPYGGTSTFNDPATQQYEQLLNGVINRLNTPYTPPGFQDMIDSLNAYVKQLQGPAYTPDQMNLMQTQALDPLERQRQIAKEQVLQRMSQRGIPASSGIAQQALLQVDNQFNAMRTQTQAGFANNAIGLQKQQQGQAAGLLPQITGLEQQNYNNQNNNFLQAANLASIIPNLAWQRLTGASGQVQPINPTALVQLMQAISQQNSNQTINWASLLAQLGLGTANLFGSNGPFGSHN